MSKRNMLQDMELLSQLREEFEEEQETAVIAPKLKLSQRIKMQMGSYGTNKRIKALVIRGLVLFMGLMVAGQLFIQSMETINNEEPGVIPLTVAVEQVEDDLMPVPAPPPPPSS
jgi:hypothetical protein